MEIIKNSRGRIVSPTHNDFKQGDLFPFYLETNNKEKNKIEEVNNNTQYPIFSYIFNNPTSHLINKASFIPFDQIVTRMRSYSDPLLSDFYEETRNLAWLERQPLFFEYSFFNNELWTWYDTEEEEFKHYIKTYNNKKDPDSAKKFLNIETNEIEIFEAPEELVKFDWDGRKTNRGVLWFNLALKMEEYLLTFHKLVQLCRKRITFNVLEDKDFINLNHINLIRNDFNNLNPDLVNSGANIGLNKLENILEFSDLELYLRAIYLWFDREISELNRVANLNPKKERKTAGENYIAVDRQSDYLRSIQDRLDLYSLKIEKRGWPKLIFKVNTEKSLGMGEDETSEQIGKQMPEQEEAA